MRAERVTAPVPWMSSLKQGMSSEREKRGESRDTESGVFGQARSTRSERPTYQHTCPADAARSSVQSPRSGSKHQAIVEDRRQRLSMVSTTPNERKGEKRKKQKTHEELFAVVDELVDEVVVDLSTHTRSFPAEVERVGEEGVVVGPDVEDDGKDSVRVDARSEGVESGFGGGNLHLGRRVNKEERTKSKISGEIKQEVWLKTDGDSSATLVSDTQDGLRVGDDDEVDGGLL
jgi:hypothetical protein